MQPWAHGQQMPPPHMYRNFYPNVTASGTPMNYGGTAYYPPTTYPASYGGGYGPNTTTAGYAASRNYTSNAGQSFGPQVPTTYGGNVPYTSGPSQSNTAGYHGTSAGQANGTSGANSGGGTYTATTGPHQNLNYDAALMTAMQQMSIGN